MLHPVSVPNNPVEALLRQLSLLLCVCGHGKRENGERDAGIKSVPHIVNPHP